MIEYALAVVLIGAMPARALFKTLRGANTKAQADRLRRYFISSAIIAGLLVLLAYCWLHAARSSALLGLDVPVSWRGLVGLAVAGALFTALAITDVVMKRKGGESRNEKARRKLAGNDLLPRNRQELVAFLGFALLAGCGWELLYRGFLIWFLVPRIGTVGAICVAALAYGAAHGYKTREQFLGSMASAFAFTIAFVLTASLWWLMVVHTVAGVAGGYSSYKLLAKRNEDPLLDNAGASAP